MAAADYTSVVQQLYVAYFGRPADPIGLTNLANALDAASAPTTIDGLVNAYYTNATVKERIDAFGLSTESASLYSGSTATFVNAIFQNVLNRAPALSGLLYWAGEIDAGRVTRGNAALAIMNGALSNTTAQGLIDAQVVTNKLAVAASFTTDLDSSAEVVAYSGSTAAASARAMLSTVTNTTDTTAFQATVTSTVASIVETNANIGGTTYTLATGMENIVGGSYNDVIYGTVSASSSLNPYDIINGGSGTDTLNVTLNGASYAADSTISNIEVINVRASTAHNFDANALTGVTSMTLEGSVAASSFLNIGSASTAIGMKNISSGAADLTAVFADAALTGTNDTVTINLNAAGNASNAPDILVQTTASTNGAETLSVVTSGTASVLGKLESTNSTGTGAANSVLKTLTVSGDKNLTVNTAIEFASSTGTVDATTMTGKLSVGLDTGGIVKVTGGTGDDTFAFTTGLTTDDTVNGGNGTDTVSFTDINTFTLANYKLSNVEILDQTATNNQDLSMVTGGSTLTKVVLRENGTDGKTISATDLAAGVAVDLVQVGTGAVQMATTTLGLKDASGTADALTVTLKGVATATAANNLVDDLVVSNIETLNLVSSSTSTTGAVLAAADANTITTITADTTLGTINASGSSALTMTVGAAATKLTKLDGSAMTADLSVTLAAGDVSVSGGSGDDTFAFAATLNNKDTVVGGGNSLSTTEDLLTADVTGLTATTGVLTVSGVERLNLTNTGTAVLSAAAITGATEVAVNGASTATTISGLANGAAVGLGFKGLDSTVQGTLTASLADATGTADSITFNLNDIGDGDTNTVALKTTSIETVNLAYSATAAALASTTITATNLAASTIKISGSDTDADNVVTLNSVNAATSTIDASTFKGKLIATANTNTATAILANGLVANNISGGSKADVVTIGAATNTLVQTVAGGAGSDTLNITLKAGNQDFTSISAFETINVTVADSAAVAMTNVAGFEDANLTKLTITGGNSLSTFTNTADTITATTALTTIDASGFKGAASLFFADDTLTSANSITGGAGNDTVDAIYTNSSQTLKMSAIDNLNITNSGGASTIDLASVTGLSKIVMKDVATAVTLTNYDLATTLQLGLGVDGVAGTDVDNVAITVTGASVSGAADTLNVKVQNVNPTASIVANGVETINLSVATDAGAAQALSVSDTNATNKYVVNITDGTAAAGFTLSGLTSDATTVNASTFVGDLTFTAAARAGSSAMTITGGTGGDSLNMKHASDVIDGGTGTDTLAIVQNAVLGGFQIDLTSTVDQITTYNGSANSAVQKGFENVNLSGVTGVFGADITANSAGSTITGTTNADVITSGAGADRLVMTGGADVINSFTIVTDKMSFSLTGINGTSADTVAVAADAASTDLTTGKIIIFANGADGAAGTAITDYTSNAQAITFLAGNLTEAAGEAYVALVNDLAGQDVYVYYINTVDGTIDTASEVSLIGTFNNIGSTAMVATSIV